MAQTTYRIQVVPWERTQEKIDDDVAERLAAEIKRVHKRVREVEVRRGRIIVTHDDANMVSLGIMVSRILLIIKRYHFMHKAFVSQPHHADEFTMKTTD